MRSSPLAVSLITHARLGANGIGKLKNRGRKTAGEDDQGRAGRVEAGGSEGAPRASASRAHRRAQGRAQRERSDPSEAAHRPVRACADQREGADARRQRSDAQPMGPAGADGPVAPGRARRPHLAPQRSRPPHAEPPGRPSVR